MDLNNWVKGTFGGSILGIGILIATYGEKFAAALGAVLDFFLTLSDKASLGVWAFLLAVAISVTGQWWVGRFLTVKCVESKNAILAGIGFVFASVVMFVQLPTRNGLLLAILAGFLSPFIRQCLAALIGLAWRVKKADPA